MIKSHRNAREIGRGSRRLRMPSPALVVAAIAFAVALGGTSYAAVALPEDSVGPRQIRDGAVTSVAVRDGSLRLVDIAAGTRRALTGPRGPKGDAGPAGASGVEVVRASSFFGSSPERKLVVDCPAGKRIVGGGAGAWGRAMIFIPRGVALTASHALDEDSWLAAAQELVPTEQQWFLVVTVVCAAAPAG